MDKVITINSLAEYIDYISKHTNNDFYFRGESCYFDNRISSGLRNINYFDFGQDEKDRTPFFYYIKEFYMEISNRLNTIDRNNFIAFAQHHGIPTNLLDVSKDPLVALYFACQDNVDSNYGYIYLFQKDNILDITQYLPKYNMYNDSEFILELCKLEEESLKSTMRLFQNFFKDKIELFKLLFLNLIEERKSVGLDLDSKLCEDRILEIFNSCYTNQKIELFSLKVNDYYFNIIEIIQNIKDKLGIKYNLEDITNDDINKFITIYTLLTIDYFKHIINVGEPVFWINFLPIFKYETTSSFERIKNQKGLFFYQCYLRYREPVYGVNGCPIQRIAHNKEIQIQNKSKILKDLDKIGVNRKTIFDDFDNIARYIVQK